MDTGFLETSSSDHAAAEHVGLGPSRTKPRPSRRARVASAATAEDFLAIRPSKQHVESPFALLCQHYTRILVRTIVILVTSTPTPATRWEVYPPYASPSTVSDHSRLRCTSTCILSFQSPTCCTSSSIDRCAIAFVEIRFGRSFHCSLIEWAPHCEMPQDQTGPKHERGTERQ